MLKVGSLQQSVLAIIAENIVIDKNCKWIIMLLHQFLERRRLLPPVRFFKDRASLEEAIAEDLP